MPGQLVMLGAEKRRYFGYDAIEDIVMLHRTAIMSKGYSTIVALLRGGAYPAAMLSQATSIPMATATFDRSTGVATVSLSPVAPGSQRILLTEDVAGKGFTLVRVKEHLETLGYVVDTFTICFDAASRMVPTFGVRLPPGERYIFPWERAILGETKAERAVADAELEHWQTGFDLDGVFVPDLPEELYEQDLEHALDLRDKLSAWDRPPMWKDGGTIVSGRLECDRDRTMAFLDRIGVKVGQLVLRSSLTEQPGVFKRRMCVELGLCEFVESDAGQARVIAQMPHLVVWHFESGHLERVRSA